MASVPEIPPLDELFNNELEPYFDEMFSYDGLEDLLMTMLSNGSRSGPPPASKASIEAMPEVKVSDAGNECVICRQEFKVGGVAKEMPCKHKFHGDCVEKWLLQQGTCPTCRYRMPVEEKIYH